MSTVINQFVNEEVEIQVVEVHGFKFLATFWDKESEQKVDQLVYEKETYGGAVNQAFLWLTDYAKDGTKPKQ